jgi:hypothetical protein
MNGPHHVQRRVRHRNTTAGMKIADRKPLGVAFTSLQASRQLPIRAFCA